MSKTKIGIVERARKAVETQDQDERSAILKKVDGKAFRFASAKTVRKVKRLLKAN